jgi:hypothetical protein
MLMHESRAIDMLKMCCELPSVQYKHSGSVEPKDVFDGTSFRGSNCLAKSTRQSKFTDVHVWSWEIVRMGRNVATKGAACKCYGPLYAGKKYAWMPLLFFSVKTMFPSIILLPCPRLGELPNICSRLLTSDLNFVKRRMRHFFPVQEKAVDVSYCIIFEYDVIAGSHVKFLVYGRQRCGIHFRILKVFLVFSPESRIGRYSL